eukprot:5981730-Amphidinium_carterae.1
MECWLLWVVFHGAGFRQSSTGMMTSAGAHLDDWVLAVEPSKKEETRNQLMYLSKDQFRAVRELLYDARLRIDETFYYGRWEQLFQLPSEDDALAQAVNVTEEPEQSEEPEERFPDTFKRKKKSWEYQIVLEPPIIKLRNDVVARAGEADEELHVDEGEEELQEDEREAEYEERDDDQEVKLHRYRSINGNSRTPNW